MPLWMAKGDSLARSLSFSVGSRMMNRGQSSLAETVRVSSTFWSESESIERGRFLFGLFMLVYFVSPSPLPTQSNKGVCRAVETDRCTPGIRGRYTGAMKRK